MKSKISHQFLLCTIISTLSVAAYAVPPYLGISVGDNLSFSNSTCVDVAKEALRQNGFDKVVQYKGSATVFAAYRNDNPYHYKAVVKCLATSGSIIVVAVANIPRNAKKKADELRRKIQKHNSIKPQSTQEPAPNPPDTEEESQEVMILEENSTHESTEPEVTTSGKTSEAWHQTVLSLNDCLIRAESSLRDSGFYKNIEFDENSAYGKHQKGYDGAVHCLTTENEVLFQVTGAHLSTRKQLLETLQRKF